VLICRQATESKIPAEEALAKELSGKYFLQLSNQLISQSSADYAKCGALAKSEILVTLLLPIMFISSHMVEREIFLL
jgi:hypothetical protein